MPEIEFYSILTKKGKEKEMACLAGNQEFDIWEIAVGDSNGSYYEPDEAQTSLKNECWRGSVIRCENEDNTRYAIAEIPADKGGFTIREIGGFDKSGNLVIIGKFPENVKRLPETGDIKQLALRLDLSVVNELVLPLIVDPSINTPSVDYVEKHFQALREKGQPEGYASLNKYGRVPVNQVPNFIRGCVNSGPVDETGCPAILSFDENTNSVLVNTPFIYTTYSGETYNVSTPLQTVIDENMTGKIRFWVDVDNNGEFFAQPLTNNIYRQKTAPPNPLENDVWINNSVAPETEFRFINGSWVVYNGVEIGSMTLVSENVTV